MGEFVRTKVFANDDETEEIEKLAATARTTPVIALSSVHALEQGGFSGDAWKRVHETVYRYALAHDLPEIEGYYGFDSATGEFLK